MEIGGIIPALCTAFDEREELDLAAEQQLVERLVAEGVHGLFACGTSGEFPLLTLEERERLLECVVAAAAGRVPVIAHVGAPRLPDVFRLVRHADRCDAAALAAVPPYYYATTADAVLAFFREVADWTDLPFFAYHIPARTGFRLTPELVREALVTIPRFAGVKYSEPDMWLLERLMDAGGGHLTFLSGSDETLASAAAVGVHGAVGSTFNFLAPLFLDLWSRLHEGRWEEARRLQARANAVIAVLHRYPDVAGLKEALRLSGRNCGKPRRPLPRLGKDALRNLRSDLEAAGLTVAG